MIYVDESLVKVGGIILPGLFKSLEIKSEALVEEQEVEGSSVKPKQAIGYDDAKINLELVLEDSPNQKAIEKLKVLQNLFKKPNQTKPTVYDIVNEHTAARGITRVILKGMSSKEDNKKSQITVTLEFWEYIPMTISASKTSSSSSNANINLSENYKNYLNTNRGSAPAIKNKTSATVAVDDAKPRGYTK